MNWIKYIIIIPFALCVLFLLNIMLGCFIMDEGKKRCISPLLMQCRFLFIAELSSW